MIISFKNKIMSTGLYSFLKCPDQSTENPCKVCHQYWLHRRQTVILILNVRISAFIKMTGWHGSELSRYVLLPNSYPAFESISEISIIVLLRLFCCLVYEAWFPSDQLRPRHRPFPSENKAISVRDDCSTS